MDRTRGRGNSAHPGLTASPSGQSLLWPLRRRHCDGAFRHRHPFAHSTMGSRRASAVGRQRVDRERPWWQHLELLALITLSPFAATHRFIEMNLDEDWLTRRLHED